MARALGRTPHYRPVLERLEDRLTPTGYAFTPGNVLAARTGDANRGVWGDPLELREYTPAGVLVQTISLAGESRDLAIDRYGNVHIWTGTFSPVLTTLHVATGVFMTQTMSGWSTVNNLGYGGITTFGDYVFAADMSTGGGEQKGIVRFHVSGAEAPVRFATNIGPADVNMGLDGLLWASGGGTNYAYAYDPVTLAPVKTVVFNDLVKALAVGADGHFYTVRDDGRIGHYLPSGGLAVDITAGTFGGLIDIDLSPGGQIVVGSHGGNFVITDTSLDATVEIVTPPTFFNFTTWIPVTETEAVNDSFSVSEDATLMGNVADNDVVAGVATFQLVDGPDYAAAFAFNDDGSFSYTPTVNFHGADAFTYLIVIGGEAQASAAVFIEVDSVNDAPTITAPATVQTQFNVPFIFSGASAIAVADIDLGAGLARLALRVEHGLLRLSTTAALAFDAGFGNDSAEIRAAGSLQDLTAALDGLRYLPTLGYGGPDALQVTVDDQSGTSTATAGATVAIDVIANQAPVITAPATAALWFETSFVFADAGVIHIADLDVGDGPLQVVLHVEHGILKLTGTAGLTFAPDYGNESAEIHVAGSLADLNAALDGLEYLAAAGFSGPDTLTIHVDDLSGSANSTDTASVTIAVAPPNQAPTITAPVSATTTRNTPLLFTGANLISVADADVGDNDEVRIVLKVDNGKLFLAATVGLTFDSGFGNGTEHIRATGRLADINAALLGLRFVPTTGYVGPTDLSIKVNDLGHTGGAALETSAQVAVHVYQNVTGKVRIKWPKVFHDLGDQQFKGVFEIVNRSNQTIKGPIQLYFPNLPPGVTVVAATTIAKLRPGESAKLRVTFHNPVGYPLKSLRTFYPPIVLR